MDPIRVLYDGWPLIYHSSSPAALHLFALLAYLPPSVLPILALPGEKPSWLTAELIEQIHPMPNNPKSHTVWEQRILPQLGLQLDAQLIHLTSTSPSLFASLPSLLSPTNWPGDRQTSGFVNRLRAALAHGGIARLRGILWPADLPEPDMDERLIRLSPMVHPDFTSGEPADLPLLDDLSLPETYVLYHGSYAESVIRPLLAAWSWAAGSIGSLYPLVMMGADPAIRDQLTRMLDTYDLRDTVLILPDLPPSWVPVLYRRCSAAFHPAPAAPWGGALRHALASGIPIVAADDNFSDAQVGPAAYLLSTSSPRKLGAALITVIVEEQVAEGLSQAARQRATTWNSAVFGGQLVAAYRSILRES